jgi:hypothetical protein
MNGYSQFFRASFEPYLGLNYYHSVRSNYEFEPFHGVQTNLGLKVYTHFGNLFDLTAAFGFTNNPSDGEKFANVTAKYTFLRNYQTGFSCFAEAGLEISDYGEAGIPLYFGTSQKLAERVTFNFRVRIPTFLDVKYFYDVNQFKTGVEFGLQFAFPKFRKPEPLTVFGNPFILM